MINMSLCGSGFLGIYQLGAVKALLSHAPKFISDIHKVAGASAGALAGTLVVCAPDKIDDCKEFVLTLADDVRRKPAGPLTPGFNLLDNVEEFLDNHLPANGHVTATNKLYINLTNVTKRQSDIVCYYKNNEELKQVLLASCYIPAYAGTNLPVINGNRYFDGGFTDSLYIFPDGRTVTVSPFCGGQDIAPVDPLGMGLHVTITKQRFQANGKNVVRALHGLFPPSHKELLQYYDAGSRDAMAFLKKEKLIEK